MKNINMTVDECVEVLTEICKKYNINCSVDRSVNNPQLYNFKLNTKAKEGLLRIYVTARGLTLDNTAGKDKNLNKLVYNEFVNYEKIEKVENRSVTYRGLKTFEIDKIKKLLYSEFSHLQIKEEKRSNNEAYRLKIINNDSKESVTVIQFNNGSLQIVGLKYNLWEDVCYLVERTLKVPISQIIRRFTNDALITDDDIKNIDFNQTIVKNTLSEEVANFLYSHDLNVLISAQCIVSSKMKMPDYSVVLGPVLKAMEGYFKKVLITLGIVKQIDMNNQWDFGSVFEMDRQLKACFHDNLSSDEGKRKKQLQALSVLCDQMWVSRNPLNHSGPKPRMIVDNYQDFINRYNKSLEIIKNTFHSIIK